MVLKIRELIQSWHHLGASGDEILLKCIKDSVDGAREFAGIYDELLKKGFSQRDSVEGAMQGAELLIASPGYDRHLPDTKKAAIAAALELATRIATYKPISPPVTPKGPVGLAMDRAFDAFENALLGPTAVTHAVPTQAPPKPTFESSLSEHERKCVVCREQALKTWNAKNGVV